MPKVYCAECLWHGAQTEIDQIDDPRGSGAWSVCPSCRAACHIHVACDEAGCWEPATCGTPVPGGYRQTCGPHRPTPLNPPNPQGE